MSNEIRVTNSLQLAKGSLNYQSRPTAFLADLAGTRGPSPGAFQATTGGVNADLSKLATQGGWCFLQNTDTSNYVTYGVWNGATFFPLGELLPGEAVVLRLSRTLLYGSSGTALVNSLRLVANTAACEVRVDAFDK